MNFDWVLDLLKGLAADPGASVTVPVTTTFAPGIPQRPPSIFYPSPNYKRTPGRRISCVIIHATEGGLHGSLAELCDPKPADPTKRVSAHYVVDRDGTVYLLVHEEDTAWHAGLSFWQGQEGVNHFSVGIELVNTNDGVDPYPEPQIAATAALTRAICADHGIAPFDVIGHADIAPGRKHDPGFAFPWQNFRGRLT